MWLTFEQNAAASKVYNNNETVDYRQTHLIFFSKTPNFTGNSFFAHLIRNRRYQS